jgi:hypothetical protein
LFYANSSRYDLPGGSNPQTPNAFSDDNAIASDFIFMTGNDNTPSTQIHLATLGTNVPKGNPASNIF